MSDNKQVIAPIIHNNGTRQSALLEMYFQVYQTLDRAYDLMKLCAPNGRDYYPKPGLLQEAIKQHDLILKGFENNLSLIDGIIGAIDSQEPNEH